MKHFNISPETQTINYVEGIEMVKNVVNLLEQQLENPDGLLSCTKDFFGNQLDKSDPTLKALKEHQRNDALFQAILKGWPSFNY